MHSEKNGKVREVFKKIDINDVNIACKYHFPKGVKPIHFQIDENEENPKHCIIGIGDSGITAVEKIIKGNRDYLSLMADISHENLDKVKAENKLYLMGDAKDKEMLTVENRRTLSEFVKAYKKVYIVTRLDNDLNECNVAEKMVQHLRYIKREVVVIAIKPFLFELPPWREALVNDTLNDFEKYIQKLIVLDSEDLLGIEEVSALSLRESFDILNKMLASVMSGDYEYGEGIRINIHLSELLNEK